VIKEVPVVTAKEEMDAEDDKEEVEIVTTHDDPAVCLFSGDYNDTVEK